MSAGMLEAGVIFHTCWLQLLERGHIYVVWHARSEVIFHACQLQRLERAHIYVGWHVRSRVILHTCQLHRLEQAHIYVGWNAKGANNISGPIHNLRFRILSRPTLAGMLYAPL